MVSFTLVLGPARSGKSRWAEHLASQAGRPVVYLATGPDGTQDPAWQERLASHRRRRPAHWECWEVGAGLASAVEQLGTGQLGLVDSLGTWVAHGLALEQVAWEQACGRLLDVISTHPGALIVVSEQTGWGVVPATAIGGLFRDRLGVIEQRLMALADRHWLVLAGRAIDLGAISQPLPNDD